LFSAANDSECFGATVTALLAKTIFVCYGPSIQHVGLRRVVLAHVYHKVNPILSLEYVYQATRNLNCKLNKSEPDEGDLFIAFFLSLWHYEEEIHAVHHDGQSYCAEQHGHGVFAIMKYLSGKVDNSCLLRVFWPMIRDILVVPMWSDGGYNGLNDFVIGDRMDQRERYERAILARNDDDDLMRLESLRRYRTGFLMTIHQFQYTKDTFAGHSAQLYSIINVTQARCLRLHTHIVL